MTCVGRSSYLWFETELTAFYLKSSAGICFTNKKRIYLGVHIPHAESVPFLFNIVLATHTSVSSSVFSLFLQCVFGLGSMVPVSDTLLWKHGYSSF